MKRNIFYLISIVFALLLTACEANNEDFGNERICLTRYLTTIPVESSYFSYSAEPDSNEPVEKLISVAGISKSGYFLNPSPVDIEMEIEEGYVDSLLNELSKPDVVMTDELEHINGGLLLPEDCYSIESMRLKMEGDNYSVAIPVKLNMEKVKQLNSYIRWILPAFRIKSANIEINNVIERTVVALDFKYLDSRPVPAPLPDDMTGWTNLILNLPHAQISSSVLWDASVHHTYYTVDGNTDINVNSARWVPSTKYNETETPWIEYDLGGTFDVDGLKIYYQNEKESGQSDVTPRANCYLWAKIDNRWFKQEDLVENTELIPSYQLSLKNVTNVRISWDFLREPTVSYFLKVKEIEIYKKP